MQARHRRIFPLSRLPDGLFQGIQILDSHLLGQLIVYGGGAALAQLLDIDLELRVLAGQLGVGVLIGEADLDRKVIPGLGAPDLFDESGDEGDGGKFEEEVLCRPALEGLAVDPAEEVDHQGIALGRWADLFHGLEAGLILGQIPDGLVDLGVADLDDEPFQLQL